MVGDCRYTRIFCGSKLLWKCKSSEYLNFVSYERRLHSVCTTNKLDPTTNNICSITLSSSSSNCIPLIIIPLIYTSDNIFLGMIWNSPLFFYAQKNISLQEVYPFFFIPQMISLYQYSVSNSTCYNKLILYQNSPSFFIPLNILNSLLFF